MDSKTLTVHDQVRCALDGISGKPSSNKPEIQWTGSRQSGYIGVCASKEHSEPSNMSKKKYAKSWPEYRQVFVWKVVERDKTELSRGIVGIMRRIGGQASVARLV